MEKYLLFMDVAGDVDLALAKENELRFVPMEFIIDGESRIYDETPEGLNVNDFYNWIKEDKQIRTTQINSYKYEEFFSPYLKEGYSVLYLCLSSGLSSTYQSACAAAEELKKKYPEAKLVPVDSLLATAPMGLLCERMIENKNKGLSIDENAKDLNEMKRKVAGYVFVDDLNSLKRGGRISPAVAFVGALLNIKPIITIYDGTLHMVDKQKGVKNSIRKLCEYFEEQHDFSVSDTCYIADACEKEHSDETEAAVRAAVPDCTIKKRFLSPIIGAHLGKGAIVISFWKK